VAYLDILLHLFFLCSKEKQRKPSANVASTSPTFLSNRRPPEYEFRAFVPR